MPAWHLRYVAVGGFRSVGPLGLIISLATVHIIGGEVVAVPESVMFKLNLDGKEWEGQG